MSNLTLEGEPGWRAINPLKQSFVSGDPDGERLRVRYFLRGEQQLIGRVWFGPGTVGPPGHAHGGSMAAVLDEAMGIAAWLSGYAVVAANLQVQFRQLLPLGSIAHLETSVEATEGRRISMRAALSDSAGKIYAESTGTFVDMGKEHFKKLREQH